VSVAEPRTPRLSANARRKLTHGGFIAIAVLYVGVLVIAPLVGIAVAALKAGLSTIVETLRLRVMAWGWAARRVR